MPRIMMCGSTTLAWRRQMETQIRRERCMNVQLPTCLLQQRRSFGGDTFICGSIMLCLRSSRQRYIRLLYFYLVSSVILTPWQDVSRTREVYSECLKLVPHKIFSFSKLWTMFAKFEVRQKDVSAARKVLGNAIGMAPKDKIFQAYIELEFQLGSICIIMKLYY